MNSVLDPQIVIDFLRGLSEQQLAGVFGSLGVLVVTAVVPFLINSYRAVVFGARTTYRAGRWVAHKTYDTVRTKPSRTAARVLEILESEDLGLNEANKMLMAPGFSYTFTNDKTCSPVSIYIGAKRDWDVESLLNAADKNLIASVAKKRVAELRAQDRDEKVQLSEVLFDERAAARKTKV